MVTILKEKDGKLYCGHCRMGVVDLSQSTNCEFCGYSWANWERMMEKFYTEEWEAKVYEDYKNGRA